MAVSISKCWRCGELIHHVDGEWIHKFGADVGRVSHPASPLPPEDSAGVQPEPAGGGPPDRDNPRPRKGGPS